MVLPLETGIIYGPLTSRRLGLSLGINLLPATVKVCNFDCLYCHYGLTPPQTVPTRGLPDANRVCAAVERALRSDMRFDSLTFSGNGEPTMHPQFADIVAQVKQLRDRWRPQAVLTLYSNAVAVTEPEIRETLQYFDRPILKLDTGDARIFRQLNRPRVDLALADIIAGLKCVPNVTLQTLLVAGPVSNSSPGALASWQAVLADIRPAAVQLYSCDYPVPVASVERVLPYVLKRIAAGTTALAGIQVKAYWIS
ncbi:MAG: radical SAM protein [Anaerolineae bacterium]|nr:radical SAM protein [Anaerolineae bacterium]